MLCSQFDISLAQIPLTIGSCEGIYFWKNQDRKQVFKLSMTNFKQLLRPISFQLFILI